MAQTVLTVEQLQDLVEVVTNAGAFAFDIESRGILERHDDVNKHFLKECAEHITTLKSPTADTVTRSTEVVKLRYLKDLALDPLRNEVFWIGIATHGRSWAIPMGHLQGEVLIPEQRGDGDTIPPVGYRKVLKSGEESLAKARYLIPGVYSDPPKQLTRYDVFEILRPLFFSPLTKVGHNVKFDARSLKKYYGEIPPGPYMDTMVLQHIEDENLQSFSLVNLIAHNFGSHSAYAREGKLASVINSVPFGAACRYVHLDARWTWLLYKKLLAKIGLTPSLQEVVEQDMQVLEVLMHMEDDGILVDSKALKTLRKELELRQKECLLAIADHSYSGFNPDSNKEKQEFLFNKKRDGGLGLKPVKKTLKGAPSVDKEALTKLLDKHPLIPLLLGYAELQKTKSTYVDGLIPKLNKGRLHPSFHLHRTDTGRLSSSNPNLQNIPRDSTIRSLFIPPIGYSMLVADYDQIELRVMAMFSQDSKLLRIFKNNEDIHTATAAAVFKVPVEDVTAEQRQIGKGVNFLTAYGGGAVKLARVTGIEDDHAEEILRAYYSNFSELTKWKQVAIAKATKVGYVTTISGRRRRLANLNHPSRELQSQAQRQAINAIIQGSAADLCKTAMIDVYKAFEGSDSHMLLQIHDELVATTPLGRESETIEMLMSAMGHNRSIMGVTLRVSCHASTSWSEAKGK